ncbi:hypothetical protein NKJ23_30050 [Mesorhizobium sp. M0184]|uniref:hypothetical protein n=1 Tax=Mesorhizobium sp. M0184 TaxID=2956906 RepID=UPI00333C8E5D
MPFTISSRFIGDFKLGDNIVFNLKVLKALYDYRAVGNPQQRVYLLKPMIITNVSIIDAVLHDFYFRVRNHTREGVANLAEAIIAKLQGMVRIDKLELYIAQAQTNDLFGEPGEFYEQLHDLRKLRNRVHIQNEKRHFDPDDRHAFSEARLLQSEQALEKVLSTMAAKHSRKHDHVEDFELPWDRHFA